MGIKRQGLDWGGRHQASWGRNKVTVKRQQKEKDEKAQTSVLPALGKWDI